MDISGIDYLGLDRVLRRGSGDIIAQQDDALFIRDRDSGAYLLACEDAAIAMPLLDQQYKMMYNEQKVLGGFCMLSVIVMEKIAKQILQG